MLAPCFHSPVADCSPNLAGSALEGGFGGTPWVLQVLRLLVQGAQV